MNPLLTLPRVVAVEDGPDVGVPGHHGDPLAEQRAMDRSAAVVDRSNREVIAVPGEDRLSWLHLLLTQHVSELPEGSGTEALVLDLNGRVEHHMIVSHVGDTVWLDVDPGRSEALLDYLRKMVFWSKVEPRSATDELAMLSVVGPTAPAVLAEAGVPVPAEPYGSVSLPDGGLVRRMPGLAGPLASGANHYAFDLLVPRAELVGWWQRLRSAGAAAAGAIAYEALRVGALRPRLGVDTDERTIPHEVGWIGSAVHLTKGCYRGQETVARVANLGRPPRKLVLLHTESGDDEPLHPGDPVLLGGRTVGRVGSWALHHELGGVALALVKRSTAVDAELTAGVPGDAETRDRLTPVRIDPDSAPAEDETPPPGRAAQARTARALRP
ncbi:YgfZ/GcvT domain-containing protein [Pseudonocardia spinosispora]|uniref:CAF17-like 4Fe-4S cluster assembly/insertion protein YgfZ n=1 Tax=Pseudonocardia spinosispora TaxID=103441 RepID=UPI00041BD44B|nr:glycine cleavage T C-terminal barrel domain-containing protein [Pseudonocardia spinosispora]